MTEPVAAVTEHLVNYGLGALTSLLDGKPDVQIAAHEPMTALPHGVRPDELTGWKSKWIQFTWQSSWGTVWPFVGAWGSHCKFKLHYMYGGQYNGRGQYLSNIVLTRGSHWDPSVESRMRVQFGPKEAPVYANQAGEEPNAFLRVHISLHEHMDQAFLTGSLEKDWTFSLWGSGHWREE